MVDKQLKATKFGSKLSGSLTNAKTKITTLFKSGKKASGLKGKDFEDYLVRNTKGASGSFKIQGREFDGRSGNTWWEAKSGRYWQDHCSTVKDQNKFKSDIGAHNAIAKSQGKKFILYSNTPIPKEIQKWLKSKKIPFKIKNRVNYHGCKY